MKKILYPLYIAIIAIGSFALSPAAAPVAHAADYTNGHLMDDTVFDNASTMSEAQIQAFLASKGPCLVNITDADPNYSPSTGWTYGAQVPASRIIYKAAQQWGINPQVILATLQKEESLITGTSCDNWRYMSAMGYACPDSGGCNSHYAGFVRQVLWGSWQLKFNKERSLGNTDWDGDGDLSYSGYMTQGTFKRCSSCSPNFYSGNATIDSQSVYLETGATASLYSYTPHLNQSFPGIFEGWFGSTIVPTDQPQMVWRLIQNGSGVHFYTISPAERDFAISKLGYRLEGAAFIGYPQSVANTVPVYRLYSPGGGYHFFTANTDEANIVQQRLGYRWEGIAFYVPADTSAPNTQFVTRLLQPHTGEHFLTTSNNERSYLAAHGWISEGVAFYGL